MANWSMFEAVDWYVPGLIHSKASFFIHIAILKFVVPNHVQLTLLAYYIVHSLYKLT